MATIVLGSGALSLVPAAASSPGGNTAGGALFWNVQLFLSNLAKYPQSGYRVVKLACPTTTTVASTATSTKSSPATSTAPSTSCASPPEATVPLSGTTKNGNPVQSLDKISCRHLGKSVHCIAVGTSPTNAPVMIETNDGGAHWRFVKLPHAVTQVNAISCPTAKDCWIAGASGSLGYPAIISTTDSGSTWTVDSIQGLSGFAHAPLDTISCPAISMCVAGSSASVTNVQTANFSASTPLLLVMARPAGSFSLPLFSRMGSLCCSAGSHWGGPAVIGLPGSISAISCGSPTSCWLQGGTEANFFMLLHSTDGGVDWVTPKGLSITVPPGSHGSFTDGSFLRCADADHCTGDWVIDYGLGGATPLTTFSTSDGLHWVYSTPPATAPNLGAISCPTATECVGVGSGIAESQDGGLSWTPDVASTGLGVIGASGIADVSCVAAGQCWAVGSAQYGAFVLTTVPSPALDAGSSGLPRCAAAALPEIGRPCTATPGAGALSVGPTCFASGSRSAVGSGPGPSFEAVPGSVPAAAPRVAGESLSVNKRVPLTGAWADISVAPMCREGSTWATSAIVLQDYHGSTFFQAGIRYLGPGSGVPDAFYAELQYGNGGSGHGSQPQFGLAGSPSAYSSGGETPFTDVSWFAPLTMPAIGVALRERTSRTGSVGYSVYFDGAPATPTSTTATPPPFPFSGPPVFTFTCPPSSIGPGGACAQGAANAAGPLDTVDLVSEIGSASIPMPGSCETPLSFASVHIDRHGWTSLPQPGVSVDSNGATLPWDPAARAWSPPQSVLSGSAAYLTHMELYAQDWSGAGPTSRAVPASSWQVLDTSASPQSTSIAMSDQPCDTWAGIAQP